ncbi:MAG: DUF4382 domain-containing protein, partial [Sphingobacteriia bacterium]
MGWWYYAVIKKMNGKMFTLKPSNMKKTNTLYFIASIAIVAAIILSACNKATSIESPLGNQSVSLYLTDAPGVFDKVLIDIKSVQVLVDTGKDTRKRDTCNWDRVGSKPAHNDPSLVWHDLGVKASVYDILQLRNGLDTLLATSTISKGSIRLIRIEIGSNNSVSKDNITYPLQWPANIPNYILVKLKGNEPDEYLPRKLRLWLDFDISRSIIQERNNQFYLRPCIKFFTVKSTASVSGKIVPKEAQAVVTVFNNTDTAYALPNPEGYFKLRGLKEGTYKVFINASNGYADTTINN